MELAKSLIRSTVRAFYDTSHVLVVDVLLVHSALVNEDLARALGMQSKDLRKLCGKLREDRFLAVHSRAEVKEGQQRPIHKDYYYIDFHATIDAIKYRIFHLTQKVKSLYKPTEERKDYYCPRCKAQWTQLEVLDKISPRGDFLCHRCNFILESNEEEEGESGGHEKQSKLMDQLDGLLKLLQRIDLEDIPKNDFETALSLHVPVPRKDELNAPPRTVPLEVSQARPAGVKGIMQNTIVPIEVSLTTSSDQTAAEKAADAQRKAELATQNTLPVWHTTSTVTGEATTADGDRGYSNGSKSNLLKIEEGEKKEGIVMDDELAGYYALIAQEKENERKAGAEVENSSDEEEGFEDVEIGGSAADTPSSSTSMAANGSNPIATAPVLKAQESDTGNSAPETSTSTPAASGQISDPGEGPAPKKIRLESQDNLLKSEEISIHDVTEKESDADDDEIVEFEDAL